MQSVEDTLYPQQTLQRTALKRHHLQIMKDLNNNEIMLEKQLLKANTLWKISLLKKSIKICKANSLNDDYTSTNSFFLASHESLQSSALQSSADIKYEQRA